MKRLSVLLFFLLPLIPAGGYAAPTATIDGARITPLFDLRVRQEFLENVY